MRQYYLIVKGNPETAVDAALKRNFVDPEVITEGSDSTRIRATTREPDAASKWFTEDYDQPAPFNLGSLLWYKEE